MDINGVYWGYNPVILTFDPNFQRDILVQGHQSFFVHWPRSTALSMMNCPAPGWTASCPRGPPVLSRMYSYVFRQGLFHKWPKNCGFITWCDVCDVDLLVKSVWNIQT